MFLTLGVHVGAVNVRWVAMGRPSGDVRGGEARLLVRESQADLCSNPHALEEYGLRPSPPLADSALWPFPPATRPGRLVGAPPRPCDLRNADCRRQRRGSPICSPLLSGRFFGASRPARREILTAGAANAQSPEGHLHGHDVRLSTPLASQTFANARVPRAAGRDLSIHATIAT